MIAMADMADPSHSRPVQRHGGAGAVHPITEELKIRLFDPLRADLIVRNSARVLEQMQPDHQPRRQPRASLLGVKGSERLVEAPPLDHSRQSNRIAERRRAEKTPEFSSIASKNRQPRAAMPEWPQNAGVSRTTIYGHYATIIPLLAYALLKAACDVVAKNMTYPDALSRSCRLRSPCGARRAFRQERCRRARGLRRRRRRARASLLSGSPFALGAIECEDAIYGRFLLCCLAVAGFAVNACPARQTIVISTMPQ
jgi:hypothetical protein